MVIPSLIFLWVIRKPLTALEKNRDKG